MKLLIFARHWVYLRNFESALEALAQRGHRIHMVVNLAESLGGRGMIERLVARYPDRLSMGEAPMRSSGAWFELSRRIRHGLDYLRFLAPRYESTPHLVARARDRAPGLVLALLALPGFRNDRGRRLARLLRALERALPRVAAFERFIAQQQPDAVLITPLIDVGSPQLDYLRAAKALGLRTVLPVGSWDNLSSKALLRLMPDLVTVWNDIQRGEAIDMHGVPPERVAVTGAQCYDQWWGRGPSRSRQEFCELVGLRADTPFVLYVCSSLFRNTVDEPPFVLEWIEALRSSDDPRLKDIGLLVRPHPARLKEWQQVDLSGYRQVAFWGAHPVDQEAKDGYFDSFYYSAAVVGLSTSAFVEAAVVGKPVHTVLLPDISTTNQEGTLHFRYLLGGNLLHAARSFEEHARLLADSLTGDDGVDPQSARFAQTFVRPFGTDQPATPRFADAIERVLAAPAPPPELPTATDILWRIPLYLAAAVIGVQVRTQLWRKRFRNNARKQYKEWKRRLLVDLKRFAVQQLASKRQRVVTPPPPSALTPKPGRHRDPAKRSWGWDAPEALQVRELVTLLGRTDKPIIMGPWLSETGFELLYWIPFLTWARTYGNLNPEQLVVISRGGAAPWYTNITTNYEELLSYYTPTEFRTKNDERVAAQHGRLKHLDVSKFDREIIARVSEQRGLRGAELLHPSEMYQLFEHFWFQRAPVTLVESFTSFAPLPSPGPFAQRAQLPERYVAAKFYGNTALPDTAANRAFVTSFLADLAQHIDVVLLNTADRYDDHDDFPPALKGRIHTIEHLMRPEDNLTIQTQVIRHAEAFVGTYGGFSYLAPLLGIDTLAFYSRATGFRFDHLEVAKRVFNGLRCGAFVEMDTRSAAVVKLGFGGAASALVESIRR